MQGGRVVMVKHGTATAITGNRINNGAWAPSGYFHIALFHRADAPQQSSSCLHAAADLRAINARSAQPKAL